MTLPWGSWQTSRATKAGWGALALGAAGLVILVRRRRFLGGASIIFAVCVWAVVLNGRPWLLPLSALLYPDRIVTLLVIPLAVGLAVVARLSWHPHGG